MARPRRLEPEARREQIIEAAIGTFAEVGFGATTRDLAQRAGITQALLYRYFASKSDLAETVFERVFLGRLSPHWIAELRDRRVPLHGRLCRFYRQYTAAIFTYEWLRIFMWAGLAGEALNRRYLGHVEDRLLAPMRDEIAAEPGIAAPDMEAMWALHGGIVYIGIRRHIYGLETPAEPGPAIEATVARFLAGLAAPLSGAAAPPSRAARPAAGRSARASSRR
ncbi:TetR/AcrR family transcriptional regulator [Falsiroseomonas oryziterrae]|uniref:TetR/AcrR family transcriptional regulator n=1 Tax=Falsiroseomonas oryziterrae TaxID=2911368 RepID=UPI001F2D4D53|nr:TetR/AcrR family transcriptional regulator [Roseomonas sp. NPKOSM-4]